MRRCLPLGIILVAATVAAMLTGWRLEGRIVDGLLAGHLVLLLAAILVLMRLEDTLAWDLGGLRFVLEERLRTIEGSLTEERLWDAVERERGAERVIRGGRR